MKKIAMGRRAPALARMLIALWAGVGAQAAGMPLAAGETLLGGQVWGSGTAVSVDLADAGSSSYSIGLRLDAGAKGLWLHVAEDRSLHLVAGGPSGNGAADIKVPLTHLWCPATGYRINDFGDRIDVYGLVGAVPVPLAQIDLHDDHIVAYYNGRMLAYPAIAPPIAPSGRVGVHAGSGPLTITALEAAAIDPETERFAPTGHENGAELEAVETFADGLDHPRLFRPWYNTTAWADGVLTLGRIDTLMKFGEAEIRMDLVPSGSNLIEIGMRQTYPFTRPWNVGGTWLVFQGNSDVLRIRKSISENQAEVAVTMPQTFNTGWTVRISEDDGMLRVYREQGGGDTLLAELAETNGIREVRDANGVSAGVVPLERTERGHITIKGRGSLDNLSISGSAWHSAADRPPPLYTPDPAEVFHVETAGKLMGIHVGEMTFYAHSRPLHRFSGTEEVLRHPETDRPLYADDTRDFWLKRHSTEPALYYKTAGNPDVIRTYLRMQAWAGVDFLIFMDSSNFDRGDLNDNYLDAADRWMDAMLELRGQGVAVPRAVFWVNNGGSMDGSAMEVYERYYGKPEYRDLWLYKDGKPMLFTTQTRETHFSVLQDYFTVRSMWVTQHGLDWAHNMVSAAGASWEALEGRGNVIDGVLEHMFANPAIRHNPYHDLTAYSAIDKMPNGLFTDVGLLTDVDGGWWRGRNEGRFYQLQWRQVFEQQPQFVTSMVWNEFVHSFNQEYSRDTAPMKDGHADRYLWMLKRYVEAYKAGQPFPETLLENNFPYAGVMPVSAWEQNLNLNTEPLWAPGIDWPWPGHDTVLTNSAGGHLVLQMAREARQWTMEGAEAVFDPPVNAGFRTWLAMTVQLRDVVCERPQDYELKIRVFGGGRWTEGTYLLAEGEWQRVAMDLSGFEHRNAIDRIKVWVQGTRNTEYADWSADLEVRNAWLSGSVARTPGRYNFEVATWPQEQDGLRTGEQVPVYVVNYDTEALTHGIGLAGGSSSNVAFSTDTLLFDQIEPRGSTVLFLQGKRFVLTADEVTGHPLLSDTCAFFQYGDTVLARTLAGPEDALTGWAVNPAWNDVAAVDDGILFGTGGGMIWPEAGGIYLPGTNVVGDLRVAFNLKLVEAGSANWFHFNFRKSTQSSHHLHSGGYSIRIESHFIRLVAGSNQTLLSTDLRTVLGSGFSFANGYARVEITAVGESLSVSVNGVQVMGTNLRSLNEPLYVERGMMNFFNAANRGAYSMNTIDLEILDPPVIGAIADQRIPINTSTGPLPFTVGDGQIPADRLALSASSSNPPLLPASSIVFGGEGTGRTLTATPLDGRSGSATVTVTVHAGNRTAETRFDLAVLPVLAYGFENGSPMDWTEAAGDARQHFALVPPGLDSPNLVPHEGNSFIGLHLPGFTWGPPTYTQDSGHDTLVLRSPPFTLNGAGDLDAWLCGGTGASAGLAGVAVPDLPAASSPGGFLGIALRDASTETYVLSARKSADGQAWERVVLSAQQLAALPQDHVYTLDLVDSFHGGWGWINLDTATIPGERWNGADADPPTISIRTEGDWIRIAWPASASGAVLQASSLPGGGFTNQAFHVVEEGDEHAVYDDTDLPHRFYRLVQ